MKKLLALILLVGGTMALIGCGSGDGTADANKAAESMEGAKKPDGAPETGGGGDAKPVQPQ